ncbi:MAG: GNAT family N-acetyltransferase [Deltaproteobacteria bacterium]|nr:GNAT family N-acetyltransferase [Deltaproteobacteria bacterium]
MISSTEGFALLEGMWNRLLSVSQANNYFLRWEWLWNWWHVFNTPGDRLAILVVEEGDEAVAIAPFYAKKSLAGGILPARLLMFLGTQDGPEGDVGSDYMDIICKEGAEGAVIDAVFEYIAVNNLCDEIFLSKVAASSNAYGLIMEKGDAMGFLTEVANEFISPYIKLPSSWDDYLGSLSASMRYKIRNERRKLQRSHQAVFSKARRAEDLGLFLGELIKLHQSRWTSKGMEGAFSNQKFVEFHERVLPIMLKNGHLDLILLSDNGIIRGAIYNIVYNDKIYFYQSGIDVEKSAVSYGFVLHSHCIEDAIQRGLKEYDFLPKGGTDDYKERYTNGLRRVSDIYMALSRPVKYCVAAKKGARLAYRLIKPVRN